MVFFGRAALMTSFFLCDAEKLHLLSDYIHLLIGMECFIINRVFHAFLLLAPLPLRKNYIFHHHQQWVFSIGSIVRIRWVHIIIQVYKV